MEDKKIVVSQIEFYPMECLQVFLALDEYPSWFEMIYRSARGVYWNESKQFFYIKFQTDISWERAFQIVYEAVESELGYELVMDSNTERIGTEPAEQQMNEMRHEEKAVSASENGKAGKLRRKFRIQFLIACAVGTVGMFRLVFLMREDITRIFLGYGLVIFVEGIGYWVASCFMVDTETLLQPYRWDWDEKRIEIGIYQPFRNLMLWSCFLVFTVMRIGIIATLTRERAWYMIFPVGLGIILLFYIFDAAVIWMFLYMFNYRIVVGNAAVFLISFSGKLSRYGIDEITRLDNRYNYFSLAIGKDSILLRKSRCSNEDVKNMDQAYEYLKDRVGES